eukprot:m.9953 g.9953  ORF g.9953 m.9953 type:complete len:700 (-) comp8023_c0_seq2:78-2177(-)
MTLLGCRLSIVHNHVVAIEDFNQPHIPTVYIMDKKRKAVELELEATSSLTPPTLPLAQRLANRQLANRQQGGKTKVNDSRLIVIDDSEDDSEVEQASSSKQSHKRRKTQQSNPGESLKSATNTNATTKQTNSKSKGILQDRGRGKDKDKAKDKGKGKGKGKAVDVICIDHDDQDDSAASKRNVLLPQRKCCFTRQDLMVVAQCESEFYRNCDDYDRCRRLRLNRSTTVRELRVLIHKTLKKTYDLAHAADDIKLYSRGSKDLYSDFKINSDSQLKQALGYSWPYEELAGPNSQDLLVTISRHLDDTYKHVLVIPVVWPISIETMKRACKRKPSQVASISNTATNQVDSDVTVTTQVCVALTEASATVFDPIPVPKHIDDWQAQYREHPQHVSDLPVRRLITKNRTTIYILPIFANVTPHSKAPKSACLDDLSELLPDLRDYIEAYYDSTCKVSILPQSTVNVDLSTRSVKSNDIEMWKSRWEGTTVCYRQKKKVAEHGQLCASDLLLSIVASLTDGSFGTDAVCVLGVTLNDLYMDKTDDFTQGLAGGTRVVGAGVFSFYRYHAGFDGCDKASLKLTKTARRSLLLARAAKTAVHELGHMFSIGHCVHRQCCMNGSGNLREDFSIPEFLCPVDLAKFGTVLGENFNAIRRYCKLLQYYNQRPEYFEQALWIKNVLSILATTPAFNTSIKKFCNDLDVKL